MPRKKKEPDVAEKKKEPDVAEKKEEPEVAKKKERPDVAKKKQTKQTVVKCGLKALINKRGFKKKGKSGRQAYWRRFVKEIEQRVDITSKRYFYGTLAINCLVRMFYNKMQSLKKAPDIKVTQVFPIDNETFLRNLFMSKRPIGDQEKVLTKTEKEAEANESQEVKQLREEFRRRLRELLPCYFDKNEREFTGDSNSYVSIAKIYITNLKNHLCLNYPRFTARVLNKKVLHYLGYPDVTEEAIRCSRYKIFGQSFRGVNSQRFRESMQSLDGLVQTLRRILTLQEGVILSQSYVPPNKTNHVWAGTLLEPLLNYYAHLAHLLETAIEEGCPRKYIRMFSITPIASIKSKYLHIDTDVLYGILYDTDLRPSDVKNQRQIQRHHWYKFFNVERFEAENDKYIREFSGTLDTDSIGASAHMYHYVKEDQSKTPQQSESKKKPEKTEYIKEDNDRVLGLDPGLVSMVYLAEPLSEGKVRKYQLSRRQFAHLSNQKRSIRLSRIWNKSMRSIIKDLSRVTIKGLSQQNLERYCQMHNQHRDSLWKEYTKRRWARQRFGNYIYSRSALDRFVQRVVNDEPSKRTVIAYGGAKFGSGRGEIQVPHDKIFQAFCRHPKCKVVPRIDEFRTSKTSHKTGNILHEVYGRAPKPVRQDIAQNRRIPKELPQIRGLMLDVVRLPNGKISKSYVNRDLNAALNIRRCLVEQTRPAPLDRSNAQGPIIPPVHTMRRSARKSWHKKKKKLCGAGNVTRRRSNRNLTSSCEQEGATHAL